MSLSPLDDSIEMAYALAWVDLLRSLFIERKSLSGRERNCCFLNTGKQRFATVSAVSGLDYTDDGRASAVVDWDLDGRLDFWVINRTSPQVRFLRNRSPGAGRFVALHLTGTRCNRDAIGARITLEVSKDGPKQTKTLHAGDSYLSQSTKWMHFGVGSAESVERLVIRWPDGSREVFEDVASNRHYRVVQGKGSLKPWSRPHGTLRLPESPLAGEAPSVSKRVVLAPRPKMEPLSYENLAGETRNLAELSSNPKLVLIWAETCSICLKEMHELARNASALRQAGLDVVALRGPASVGGDGLASRDGAGPDHLMVKAVLRKIGFPFAGGMIDEKDVAVLDRMLRGVLNGHRRLAVPTSFLIDRDHRVGAVYLGAVELKTLLADVKRLESIEAWTNASLPFAGRWLASPLDGK